MNSQTAVLILGGGLSSRMGSDKATLPFKGKPLIRWVYDAARRFTDKIYISIHDESSFQRLSNILPPDVRFIYDNEGPRSVMLGLISSLPQIKEELVLILPTDSPLVDPAFLIRLAALATEYDAVIPMWPDGRIEAIHAAYRNSTTRVVVSQLWHNNTLELHKIPRSLSRVLFVGTETLNHTYSLTNSLIDADTPEELAALLSLQTAD
jgi:molybdopterin-guanine dinucleotide biosynthesis protein A